MSQFYLDDRNHDEHDGSTIPPFGHLYHTSKIINFCDVGFEKQKQVTYDELVWFMKPFAQQGESNLAGIERRSENLLDRGEQNMDFAML